MIREKTGVSISIVGFLLTGTVALTLWLLTEINNLRSDITEIKHLVTETHRECMGREVFRNWRDRLDKENSGKIQVPLIDAQRDASLGTVPTALR